MVAEALERGASGGSGRELSVRHSEAMHQAAERLINEFVDAAGTTAIISFRDAPLTDSYAKRRIGVPLDEFDQALSLLIEQTQHYRGY